MVDEGLDVRRKNLVDRFRQGLNLGVRVVASSPDPR